MSLFRKHPLQLWQSKLERLSQKTHLLENMEQVSVLISAKRLKSCGRVWGGAKVYQMLAPLVIICDTLINLQGQHQSRLQV